jgi:hypothetical protein
MRPGFSFTSIRRDSPSALERRAKKNPTSPIAKQLERHSGAKMAAAPVMAATPKFVRLLSEFFERSHSPCEDCR